MTRPDVRAHVDALADAIESRSTGDRITVVALDGRSGAGKSTLAAALVRRLDACTVIEGDDFYAGGSEAAWDAMTPAQRAEHCIDWGRQRPVLDALRSGEPATWFGYDWHAFDGRLATEPSTAPPAPVVVLEGVYSARPELRDQVDLRVLLDVPLTVRRPRLVARDGADWHEDWFARWSSAEDHYFDHIAPPSTFDLVLTAH